jgi:hypothetical protein
LILRDEAELGGAITKRPYLRCIHGDGLCLWRLLRVAEAAKVFECILTLSQNDNQGVRLSLNDVRVGRSWEEMDEREAKAHAAL